MASVCAGASDTASPDGAASLHGDGRGKAVDEGPGEPVAEALLVVGAELRVAVDDPLGGAVYLLLERDLLALHGDRRSQDDERSERVEGRAVHGSGRIGVAHARGNAGRRGLLQPSRERRSARPPRGAGPGAPGLAD